MPCFFIKGYNLKDCCVIYKAIAVKPGQSISITVGKGGAEVYQAEQNSPGKDGGYSQFMNSSYRANGGKGANKWRGGKWW